MNNNGIAGLLITAGIVNAAIIFAGSLTAGLVSRRSRLEQKGYPEPYIEFQRRFSRSFGLQFFTFVLAVQGVLIFVLFLVKDDISSWSYLELVMIPTLILALPFALLKSVQVNKAYRKLAEEHGYETAADFGFVQLKRMFRLNLEIPASLLVVSYVLLFHNWSESGIIILYILLIWFFAATVRLGRYAVSPVLKDQYMMMGRMTIIYQAILIFLLFLPMGLESWRELGNAGRIMFIAVAAGLTAKWVRYLVAYPAFARDLKGDTEND